MFTTEDQREEMLALKAKKPAANTGTTVFSAPQVINPVGLNVGFHLENSILEAEKKQQEYAEHAAGFAEVAVEKEWWGKTEDATAFWKEASRLDGISKGQLALDALALLPLVGGIKHVDDGVDAVKAVNRTADAAKHTDEIIDTAGGVSYNGIRKLDSASEDTIKQIIDTLQYGPDKLLEDGWTEITPSKMS